MNTFRTDLRLTPDPFLDHTRPILTLGSCFAEHMGQKLLDYKWKGLNAPLGTLFHPLALSKLLRLAMDGAALDPTLFVEQDGAIFHHDLHSRFYGSHPTEVQEQWQRLADALRTLVKQSPCVLLTLGTAWVYERKVDGQLVANCHKQAMDQFHKKLLRSEDIQEALESILQLLPADAPLVITLSPVRHIRDTLVGNAWSKSLLLVSIHEWIARHADRVRYFPAYEIMLDDLRDYRFYEADMIHPAALAIDYIWEKFVGYYATPAAKQFMQLWQPVLQALRHRPQRLDAPSYQKYLQKILQDLELFSGLDCSQEKAELKSRLMS